MQKQAPTENEQQHPIIAAVSNIPADPEFDAPAKIKPEAEQELDKWVTFPNSGTSLFMRQSIGSKSEFGDAQPGNSPMREPV
jgi:hypothetical protein